MCQECYMTFCPDSCPGSEPDDTPLGRCEICERYIYPESEYVSNDERLYCLECVEYFDTEQILGICGFREVVELLRELGVEVIEK